MSIPVRHKHHRMLPNGGVLFGFAKGELRDQVKQVGGQWNRRRKVGKLRYDRVVALKLEARIVEDKASNSRYQG